MAAPTPADAATLFAQARAGHPQAIGQRYALRCSELRRVALSAG